ncbi:MAG: hypothetical protein P4L99_21690 [Chthoniobacter sp.]|nr:hypothetical protein [Chthoniobacter sp.]
MKTHLLSITLALACSAAFAGPIQVTGGGASIGRNTSDKVGFHGAAPSAQRSGSAQAPVALTRATGALTIAVQPTANDTFTLGATTYTFKASVSTTANQVKIGSSLAATQTNVVDAINALPGGSGTEFGSATTANATATAAAAVANVITVTAILPGTAANSAASTSSFTSGSNAWGASTLAGGATTSVDAVGVLLDELRAALVAKGLIKGSN